jgi:hypothetical protein
MEVGQPLVLTVRPVQVADVDNWRRTVDGWEKRSEWQPSRLPPPSSPRLNLAALHPLNVAALQALLSVGALLIWSPVEARPRVVRPPAGRTMP